MQQFQGRPSTTRERKEDENRRQNVSMAEQGTYRNRRISGEPAKFNTRINQRRITWENDLYERQSI
jgi:hypothetical protein